MEENRSEEHEIAGETRSENLAKKEESLELSTESEIKLGMKKINEPHKEKKKSKIFQNKWTWITIVVLILIIALSIYIRTTNISQLKDVTTGNYTLGPDLDPFWFMRVAQEIVTYGHPLDPDMLRYAPVGYSASYNLHSYLMVDFYKFVKIFSPNIPFELSAIIFPVVCFALALLVFFLLINKLFSHMMTEKRAKVGALIATALLAVMPDLIHRTVAGIPEHEASGILFIFLALYLFLVAWESKGKKAFIFAALAGIFTGITMSDWGGGSKYIFMIIALAVFLAFLFQKIRKKEFLIYAIWIIIALVSGVLVDKGVNLVGSLKSISDAGFSFAILGLLIVDRILFNTKIKEKIKLKLPRSIISIIVSIIIVLVIGLIFKPDFVLGIFSTITSRLIHPFGTGRVGLTVAENKAPYLTDLISSFSPIVFWLFFFGSIYLFYEAVRHFKNKGIKNSLFIGFVIFIFLFLFSRYSPSSFLNGENGFSVFVYFAGLIIFAILILYNLIKAKQEDIEDFKKINFSYLLILASIFWTIISIRGAIRLFFIVGPIVLISISFLPLKLSEYLKSKDELKKIAMISLVIIIAILLVITFIKYEKTSANAAKYSIPSSYNQQWQKAMAWVRTSTPENAIFAHWWDYGYWVQSLGERPTIVDGGNYVVFWDYLIARHVLTTQNETDALEFLYAHNTSYLLIDSSDIGKYTAFSSIGSDATGIDRVSWISSFVIDEKQTYETKNSTQYVYTGGTMLDQDFVYNGQIFPMQKAGIGAFLLTIDQSKKITGLDAVLVYNGQQSRIPVRYIYVNNQLVDINGDKQGVLPGCLYVVPSLTSQGINNFGAGMYISEKVMNSLFAKLYLFNESQNFELAHNEDALLINELKTKYNVTVGDFLYAGDIYGPIKIWKINYPKNFTISEDKIKEYLSFQSNVPFVF